MAIELDEARVVLSEVIYKLKDAVESDDEGVATTFKIKSNSLNVDRGEKGWLVTANIDTIVDNVIFFFECGFIAQAEILGAQGSTVDEQKEFLQVHAADLRVLATEHFSALVNNALNGFLSGTLTPPAEFIDVWARGGGGPVISAE